MSDAPDIPHEIEDRTAQREAIKRVFTSKPLQEIDNAILKAITPHYQQRISELRRIERMDIRNIRRSTKHADGTTKRLDGDYKFHPTPGSRTGDTPSHELWPVPESPFADAEVFKLTPPT